MCIGGVLVRGGQPIRFAPKVSDAELAHGRPAFLEQLIQTRFGMSKSSRHDGAARLGIRQACSMWSSAQTQTPAMWKSFRP